MSNRKETLLVCAACDCIITPQQAQNGKSKNFCGALVHENCPQKTLATIRKETKMILLELAEKITSIRAWTRQVLEEIEEITEDSLWRIEAIIKKALAKLKEVWATAVLYADQRSKSVLHSAEMSLTAVCHRFFWKRPVTA